MLKLLVGVFVGTQIAPYVNPSIDKYVLAPLYTKLASRNAS